MKILEVMTEHTGPIKILVEVLKDMLPEANIEFLKKGDSDKKKAEIEDISDDESDSKSKSKSKTKIKKKKDKKSKQSKDEDIDEEASSDDEDDKSVKKDKGGIRITAVDMSKTVLINLKLDACNFSTFKCKKKKITLGVNLGAFHKFLKSMDKDDNLTLYQEHDSNNNLFMNINNDEGSKETDFTLKLLELKKTKLVIPDIAFEAQVTINSQEFHKICREMKSIADYVEIKCLKNKLIFTCKGDLGDRKSVYKTDSIDNKVSIEHNHKDNSKPFVIEGIYELKNLVMFAKCATLSNEIQIYLKSDYALVIKYTVATLGRLYLCLSPVKNETMQNNKYEDEEFYSDDEEEETATSK